MIEFKLVEPEHVENDVQVSLTLTFTESEIKRWASGCSLGHELRDAFERAAHRITPYEEYDRVFTHGR